MNTILFDDHAHVSLLPLTFTRPVSEIRIGILTITQKWEHHLNTKVSWFTQPYLAKKYRFSSENENLLINGSVCPTPALTEKIQSLKSGEILKKDEKVLAAVVSQSEFEAESVVKSLRLSGDSIQFTGELDIIEHPWDIYSLNLSQLESDFDLITHGRESQQLSSTNTIIGDKIFVEKGAKVEAAVVNASDAPVYIGQNAEIMEGATVRGGLAMLENSVLKMGAKIYGATTLGPHVKVGGEVNNCVIFGYSNKGHDGFLGNSVVGEWCNLGADTNNSNLKNNYGIVKAWSYLEEDFISTGKQFCGLIMGDHSKSGINTMFNTGTVVGVSANIFGSDFPSKLIPSYSWGGAKGFDTFMLEKSFEVAQRMMERRGIELTDIDKAILSEIYERTDQYRSYS